MLWEQVSEKAYRLCLELPIEIDAGARCYLSHDGRFGISPWHGKWWVMARSPENGAFTWIDVVTKIDCVYYELADAQRACSKVKI